MKIRILSVLIVVAFTAIGCKPQQADKEPKKPEAPAQSAEGKVAPPDSLAVKLLQPTDLAQLVQGELRGQLLQGIPQSDAYSSFRYNPLTHQAEYGVAIQVWKAGEGAEAQYEKDLGSYPAVVAKDEVGTRSFRGYRGGIMYVTFMDKDAGVVVSMTCGIGVCSPGVAAESEADQFKYESLVALAKVAHGRLSRLPR